jgi:hypothetical protein
MSDEAMEWWVENSWRPALRALLDSEARLKAEVESLAGRLATEKAHHHEAHGPDCVTTEEAQDIGATLMLDQMERAVTDGGLFSDARANRFVAAEAKVRELEAKLVEAQERVAFLEKARPHRRQYEALEAELAAAREEFVAIKSSADSWQKQAEAWKAEVDSEQGDG